MNRRSKVELFEEIRLRYAAGETIKALAKKHGVHRRMVRLGRAHHSLAKKHGVHRRMVRPPQSPMACKRFGSFLRQLRTRRCTFAGTRSHFGSSLITKASVSVASSP